MANIIVVEDDLEQQEEIVSFLCHAGHEARGVCDGSRMTELLESFEPSIILLDIGLPEQSGSELAGWLREQFGLAVGIIMVTARSMPRDRIEARGAGADHYLIKPVNFDELLLVINQMLFRLRHQAASPLEKWSLDVRLGRLNLPEQNSIELTEAEASLLELFARRNGHYVPRDDLICAISRNPDVYDERALQALMSRLRRKIDSTAKRNVIRAVRGVGYRLLVDLEIAASGQ